MLNKLRCHTHLQILADQIAWSSLLIQIHMLNVKQCRSRSVGFWRSQLIWIYTVCKYRAYPVSAGLGLMFHSKTSLLNIITDVWLWASWSLNLMTAVLLLCVCSWWLIQPVLALNCLLHIVQESWWFFGWWCTNSGFVLLVCSLSFIGSLCFALQSLLFFW